MSLKQIFGANLRHYRKAENLKQDEFAHRCGLSTVTISKIERGIAAPSFETIETISRVLAVPEVAFFAATPLTLPKGERGRLLQKINLHLSRLNEDGLARAEKVLAALV